MEYQIQCTATAAQEQELLNLGLQLLLLVSAVQTRDKKRIYIIYDMSFIYDKLKLYKQWDNDNNKLQATVHLFVTTATISADEVCINRKEHFGLINFLDTLCRETIVVYLIKSRLETNSWH